MANEIRVTAGVTIRNGNLDFRPQPTTYQEDQVGEGGPTPGQINVTTAGVTIDLSVLTTPGRYWIQNLDDTNYIEYGIRDPQTNRFYPWGELVPGQFETGRLSRNFTEEYGTGTGTPEGSNTMFLRAANATCKVYLAVFEA